MDTGTRQGSYISTRVAKLLEEEAGLKFERCLTRVCAAFNNCKISDKNVFPFAVTFVNNKTKHLITFKVLEIPYDLIIGRRDIWKHNLWPRFAPSPYNEQYHRVIEHTSTGKVQAQNQLDNNSELNQLSVPVTARLNTGVPKKACSQCRVSSTKLTENPHRTVEPGEAVESVCIGKLAKKKPAKRKRTTLHMLTTAAKSEGNSTLPPNKISTLRSLHGVPKSSSCQEMEAAFSRSLEADRLEEWSYGTSMFNVSSQQLRDKNVHKTRMSERHSSSISIGEPKKALTEVQAKDADRYLQLWEVTTEEQLNAFLGEYVKNTTGTANSEGVELKRAPIGTFLQREEEGEGLAVRGAELPEYDTSTANPQTKNQNAAETPKATTNYIPRDIQKDGMSKKFADAIAAVCTKRLPVFNTKLNIQPAMVPPMELEVDRSIWETPSNQGPPRNQTPMKQVAITKAMTEMTQYNIVSPTDKAEYYSHPHLTPKPPPSLDWRFTIDFRGLNLASKGSGWPIPNIPHMLQRLGEKKPKYLGKLDFTSGYHQAPLAVESRIFTAFMTFMGVYMWNRVPMGIKRAGGWFQAMLATVVLVNLIYIICELYIDDLIIHAQTEDEFCRRLDMVLGKLQERGITVNPEKCVLGVDTLEFVGHTINKDGLHFTRDKIEKVLQIPEPTVGKQLKSFLGVAVWFIEHIEGYSDLARPLHQMLKDYDKKRALKWTDEGRTAFHKIKDAINNCPMLYFIDDTSPIIVETDASDYGVGGVCYQVVDGKRRYIAFASHALAGAELNWSVPHKEMYGIVYTLTKMDYLLRDRTFTLKTDHKNLLKMNTDKNPKVYRWKLSIQDYDAHVEYIEGPKNVIADGLSRLLPTSNMPKDQSGNTHSDIDPDDYFDESNYRTVDSQEVMYNLVSEEMTERTEYTPGVISFGFASLMVPTEVLNATHESTNPYQMDLCTECNTEELNVAKEMLIPVAERAIIQKCHNPLVGHMGVERTILRLHKLGHAWDYMREHVKKFIRECPYCQKMSYQKTAIHTHPFTTAAYGPFQRINIDSIGPISASAEGYCHILVIICCFSRWVELIPLKTLEMNPTKKELIKYFGRYGEPGQVLTDGGSQFSNEEIKELIRLVGCQHTICLSYSKEENSIVERANKEVMRHLRALVYEISDFSEWEDLLPIAQRIMNGVRNESNKTSPSEIVFGNAVMLDRGLLVDHTALNDSQISLSHWASNMLQMQKKLCDRAETLQRQKDQAHLDRFPMKRTDWPVGSYVLVDYHASIIRKGPPSKMLTHLCGPMKVVAKAEDDYTLMNLVFNKTEHVHVSLIHPFVYDSNYVDPKDIARRDVISSFEVESIVDHTPKSKRQLKSKMDFKVRWQGYSEEHDLWIPFSELRDNPALHRYLWDNGMKHHINKQHRIGEFR